MPSLLARVLVLICAFSALTLISTSGAPERTSAHVSQLTVDRVAVLAPGGLGVTITGTIQCESGETFGMNVTVVQFRRVRQEAFATQSGVACSGDVQAWQLVAQGGPLQPGPASIRVQAAASGEFCCTTVFATARLARSQ